MYPTPTVEEIAALRSMVEMARSELAILGVMHVAWMAVALSMTVMASVSIAYIVAIS
jgi:hypothetical protein